MDSKTFQGLFEAHRGKISEAWVKLSDSDLDQIGGDLGRFLKKIGALYYLPEAVILKELDAVQKNIEGGIQADFSPPLDPTE